MSTKQAWEQEVVIASLFYQGTSPQAEQGRRAEPGLSGLVTRLMMDDTWPRQLYLANTLPDSDLHSNWPKQ